MIVIVSSNGCSLGLVTGWRYALTLVRRARRQRAKYTVRGATVRDMLKLPRLSVS